MARRLRSSSFASVGKIATVMPGFCEMCVCETDDIKAAQYVEILLYHQVTSLLITTLSWGLRVTITTCMIHCRDIWNMLTPV